MAHKRYSNNSIKHECHALSSFLTLKDVQELKTIITHQSSRDV